MLVKRNIYGLPLRDFWFSGKRESREGLGISVYHDEICALDEKNLIIKYPGTTIINRLDAPEDEIMSVFKSNVRNEIRRAKKDGFVSKMFCSKDIAVNKSLIPEFDIAYIEMYRAKRITTKSKRKLMGKFCSARMLYISVAYPSESENEICAYHVYVSDGKITRLLYSVSSFRNNDDKNYRNAVARANRMLHWDDMMYFKGKGCSVYDWGGYATEEDKASISEFKAGFGGEITKHTRYIFSNNPLIRVALKVYLKNQKLI